MPPTYQDTLSRLLAFRDERQWAAFHDSRNLALALSIEAAELNELFLWKNDSQSETIDPQRLREELADVLAYAFLLAAKHNLDPFAIVNDKIVQNNLKYPVDKAAGNARKYNEL